MNRAEWYVELQNTASGPFPAEQILDWIASRQILGNQRIFSYSKSSWFTAEEIPEFQAKIPPPLRLGDFTDLTAVSYSPPATKKTIPWREKKKKFWTAKKSEEKTRATLQAFVAEQRLGEIPQQAPDPVSENKPSLPDRPEILGHRPKEAAPVKANLNQEIYAFVDGLRGFETPEAPAKKRALMAQSAELANDDERFELDADAPPSDANNFHKVLFFGFLTLSLLFAALSFWLHERLPASSELTNQPLVQAAIPTPEEKPQQVIIRDGQISAPDKQGGLPNPIPANPHSPLPITL